MSQPYIKNNIDKIIDDNLDNPDLCIEDLCQKLDMSRMHLHRQLKKATGLSASRYIRAVRLQKANELLRSTEQNISEIAYEVGFRDPNYFTRKFVEEYGVAPRDFRKILIK